MINLPDQNVVIINNKSCPEQIRLQCTDTHSQRLWSNQLSDAIRDAVPEKVS